MQRFKKWFLSIIKNFKQHEKIKIDLNNTKIELSQLKKEHYKVLDFHLRKITPQTFLEIVEIHLAESCNLICRYCKVSQWVEIGKWRSSNKTKHEYLI
ncbi:hypothetical protein ACMXEJ_000078 [Campylobacter jejuni]|nr:hypothetical protein [Campylobacter jejuni]RTK02631.1 hypothetical protein C3H41_02390 [Campylobacter jejuni]HEF7702234.1 hypothetical protein [Campylobacter jejuni]HEF7706470.1 hypothetical protein [Campylobacter jejuni]HEF8756905.1 hypothetical protein [Campylobacter jejuni]